MDATEPTYRASVERICAHAAVLRLHKLPAKVCGDPYIWSCTVASDRAYEDTAFLMGAMSAPPKASWPAIHDALKAAGFVRRAHVRRKGEVVRAVAREL